MNTLQILHTLRDVRSFLGVFPADLLPTQSVIQPTCIIINVDPHTEKGTHWLSVHFQPKSPSAYYFDSYGCPPFLPTIQTFLRRNCFIWDYNKTQLQGLTSAVCGRYCCLFALYMDRGFTPQQFIGLCTTDIADQQIDQLFASEFGPHGGEDLHGGQCCCSVL
jgi:hypothetical protein